MPIPDFQSLMLPFLDSASDGKTQTLGDAREHFKFLISPTTDSSDTPTLLSSPPETTLLPGHR